MDHEGTRNLIAAVARAAKHELDIGKTDDRLTIQRGCYILNTWGYGPMYDFSMYFRGPYSPELAEACHEFNSVEGTDTDIPVETVDRLSEILSRGLDYAEAYTTVMVVIEVNPRASSDRIRDKALDVKPYLKDEILEACGCLLD